MMALTPYLEQSAVRVAQNTSQTALPISDQYQGSLLKEAEASSPSPFPIFCREKVSPMEKKKKTPSDRDLGNNAKPVGAPTSGSRSRKPMLSGFALKHALLVYDPSRAILYPDKDGTKGAAKFAELMIAFLEIQRPASKSPTFIWLVSDLTQIKHVLIYMKNHENEKISGAFEELSKYATVALRDATSPYNAMLANMAQSRTSSDRVALTASPTSGGDFSYLRHFAPSSDDDWQGGPLCEPLTNAPDELNNLSQKLLKAHGEKLNGKPGTAIEHLRKSKVSISTIREILPILVLCILQTKNVTLFSIA